ncbi:MAG: hypothetical protein QOG53_1335 [Frankiales bacterium]|jgi:hypothetical protein|nr:hypothetical protein [Frankiales bacterium]
MTEPTQDTVAEERRKKYGALPARVEPKDMIETKQTEPPNAPEIGDPSQREFMRTAGIG